MSGVYDPMLLVNHVMKYLAKQRCHPQLRASELRNAERAAQALLLTLDVKPEPVDRMRYGDYGNSGPGW